MNNRLRFARGVRAMLVIGAMSTLAVGAQAAGEGASADARASYEKERAACLTGATQQDRDACLREAGAVLNEKKQGKHNAEADKEQLKQNALVRCNAVALKDRADCELRAKGGGIKEGSVGGGAIVKETVTRQVLPPGSQVPPDSQLIGTVPSSVTVPGPSSSAPK